MQGSPGLSIRGLIFFVINAAFAYWVHATCHLAVFNDYAV
jgi:hypothetical protein